MTRRWMDLVAYQHRNGKEPLRATWPEVFIVVIIGLMLGTSLWLLS